MKNDKKNKIIIFTDGASKGNPGPGGYGAVIVLSEGKVQELGGREERTTNNRMELTGAIKALEEIRQRGRLTGEEVIVYTDSKYLIGGMTEWLANWQKKGWRAAAKKEGLNKDLWEQLAVLVKDKKIEWHYVAGHSAVSGNERCDEIASSLAMNEEVRLYSGSLAGYKIKVLDLG